jgi:pyruvate/2-oxoglutarate dehydrogenase complex dihydrolipoamide dehydrogenase (E3) component
MAQALARFGAKVTLVEAEDRLLFREAERVGTTLAEALEEEGIELRLGALAENAGQGGDGYTLTLKGGEELSAEKLLVATGRKPNVDVGLDKVGIELIRGTGRIAGPGKVEVDGSEHETERIVVATGSAPAFPPVDGLEGLDGVWTNREVTGMKEVPGSILVLGGGPVGVEMAQALARFGAKVTLVEAEDRLLFREAERVGTTLAEALEEEGVELRLGALA